MYRSGQGQTGQTGQTQSRQQTATDQHPIISGAAALPFPLEARLDSTGEAVMLLQTCDWPGHSPSYIGIDRNGKQVIESFDNVTVTDARAVPNVQVQNLRGNTVLR